MKNAIEEFLDVVDFIAFRKCVRIVRRYCGMRKPGMLMREGREFIDKKLMDASLVAKSKDERSATSSILHQQPVRKSDHAQ